MTSDKTDILEVIVWLIFLVAFLGAFYNIPSGITNQIIQWLISIFIGTAFSIVAGTLVEALTGDHLKTILINIPIIGDFSISISLFAISTFVVKIWLFSF